MAPTRKRSRASFESPALHNHAQAGILDCVRK
jgi:hypothetical protein